ncbi:UDP-N-acetylglucosamine 2-epimerase (non-hydrolyzing) [bacterium]|nr:UDP-N-acetylglucosamine 2-epimerase (non-hydrolyzing) [bacterium]
MKPVLIAHIVGARPQFVKAAAVSRALRQKPELEEWLIHTGQHYDPGMSQRFFDELGIPAAEALRIVSGKESEWNVDWATEALCSLFRERRPEAVVVHGDTLSTLAGARAAEQLGLPLAHVEAGLRSGNWAMPEEAIRVETDRLSRWLFVPHPSAAEQLRAEGLGSERGQHIETVGDVMFDSMRWVLDHNAKNQVFSEPYALVTLHRNTTLDVAERLGTMLESLLQFGKSASVPLRLILHPRLRAMTSNAPALRCLLRDHSWRLLPPQGYASMLALIQHADWVLTDSGGLQKEAALLGRPLLVLRAETEWTEWVDQGRARLVADRYDEMERAKQYFSSHKPKPLPIPTGASDRIAEILVRDLRP